MLRAEKLEWEDRFFELKSKHESVVQQLEHTGHPADATYLETAPALRKETDDGSNSLTDPVIEGIQPLTMDSRSDNSHVPTLVQDHTTGNSLRRSSGKPQQNRPTASQSSRTTQMASFIHSLDIRTLSADPGQGLSLLICPLDELGDVIPLAGKLNVSVNENRHDGKRRGLGSWRFTKDQVNAMVQDAPNQEPGILLQLPWPNPTSLAQGWEAAFQYESPDQRQFKAKIALPWQRAAANSSEIVRLATRPSSQPELISSPGVVIEFGNEANFESLPTGPTLADSKPAAAKKPGKKAASSWSPTR